MLTTINNQLNAQNIHTSTTSTSITTQFITITETLIILNSTGEIILDLSNCPHGEILNYCEIIPAIHNAHSTK